MLASLAVGPGKGKNPSPDGWFVQLPGTGGLRPQAQAGENGLGVAWWLCQAPHLALSSVPAALRSLLAAPAETAGRRPGVRQGESAAAAVASAVNTFAVRRHAWHGAESGRGGRGGRGVADCDGRAAGTGERRVASLVWTASHYGLELTLLRESPAASAVWAGPATSDCLCLQHGTTVDFPRRVFGRWFHDSAISRLAHRCICYLTEAALALAHSLALALSLFHTQLTMLEEENARLRERNKVLETLHDASQQSAAVAASAGAPAPSGPSYNTSLGGTSVRFNLPDSSGGALQSPTLSVSPKLPAADLPPAPGSGAQPSAL